MVLPLNLWAVAGEDPEPWPSLTWRHLTRPRTHAISGACLARFLGVNCGLKVASGRACRLPAAPIAKRLLGFGIPACVVTGHGMTGGGVSPAPMSRQVA